LRRLPAWPHLRDDQHRRRRVPDQLRRARPAHQRDGRALRPAGHVRRDPVRRARERAVLRRDRADRAMGAADLTARPATGERTRVWALRATIVVTLLVVWEAVSASGLLFRD